MGKQWKQWLTLFFWAPKITADGDCSHEIKRRLLLGRKVMTNLDSILKNRDIVNKGPSNQGYVFSIGHVRMWELDYKESWAPNWTSVQFTQLCPTLCNPMTVAHRASLSISNSQSLLKLISIMSVMPSNHLILCHPLIITNYLFVLCPSGFFSTSQNCSQAHSFSASSQPQDKLALHLAAPSDPSGADICIPGLVPACPWQGSNTYGLSEHSPVNIFQSRSKLSLFFS